MNKPLPGGEEIVLVVVVATVTATIVCTIWMVKAWRFLAPLRAMVDTADRNRIEPEVSLPTRPPEEFVTTADNATTAPMSRQAVNYLLEKGVPVTEYLDVIGYDDPPR